MFNGTLITHIYMDNDENLICDSPLENMSYDSGITGSTVTITIEKPSE